MDYYIDTAYVYSTFNWANVASFEPKKQERTKLGRTEFATTKANTVDFFLAVTGPRAPTANPSVQTEPIGVMTSALSASTIAPVATGMVAPTNTDVERIAKQRVQLIAAKYASGIEPPEIVARLEILNRRLLDRAPRVSKDQVVALENANDQLARIQAAREERSRRLGLPTEL